MATGILMLTMKVFAGPSAENLSLTVTDLAVMGVLLLMVEVVAVRRLVKRFSADPAGDGPAAVADPTVDRGAAPSVASIAMYGVIGVGASVVGGHAVGAFADILVISLREAGYSEMLAALLLSVFACAGAYAMIATAHVKGMYDIALANVSGAVTQVPFVVLPVVMLLMAVFAATGVTEPLPGGGVLAVDMQTTSVLLLAFPPMLVLWKAIQDDGKVNWVETSSMLSIFLLTLYFLATHG